MKISIKKGDKVVDRWYCFSPNSFKIQGVGKVLKVPTKNKLLSLNLIIKKLFSTILPTLTNLLKNIKKG
jgi:hypothetical protein